MAELLTISFEPESDCEANFSNQASFHCCKKLRDGFYLLYNQWKSLQSKSSFNSNTDSSEFKFSSSTFKLLNLSNDGTNMYHFAKLFVLQMIQTCIIGVTNDTLKINDEKDQLSSTIIATKLKKLQKRMSYGIDIKTSQFVDEEIFFYEFIVYAKNASFEKFLSLVLIDKIDEYNNLDHFLTDYREQDLINNEAHFKTAFSTYSLTLQILSKFLGFIAFSTFQTSLSPKSHPFIENQIKLRKNEQCPLDLITYLQDSLDHQKIALTLPWVLQFLRQMDPIAPHLLSYKKIFSFIHKINQDLKSEKISCDSEIRLYLLILLNSFIHDYQTFFPHKLDNYYQPLVSKSIPTVSFDQKFGLIDENFVLESSSIVQSINWSIKKRSHFKQSKTTTPRKITPVTIKMENPVKSSEVSNKLNVLKQPFESNFEDHFQKNFENQFYSLHPISLKKVIDFVSERIFSKCIKELKSELIHDIKKPFLEQLKSHEEWPEDVLNKMIKEIQVKCSHFVHTFCQSEINSILSQLLSPRDHSLKVINYSNNLAISLSNEKCCKWIEININQDWILNELKSKQSTLLMVKREKIPNFSKLFSIARGYIYNILIGNHNQISKNDIVKIISQLSDLRKCPLISEKTQVMIDFIVNDLIIAIISKKVDYHEQVLKSFIIYYQSNCLKISYFFCPRNIFIISQLSNPSSQEIFENLLIQLLNKHILNYSSFEETCLLILNSSRENTWIIYFLNSLLKKLKNKHELSELSRFLFSYWDQSFPKLS